MKKPFSDKLHILIKRVVCLTLCLTLPITCIAKVTNANADESKKKIGYEWTRIDKQSDLNNYMESGKSYRILITYDDQYYLSGMQTMNYDNDGEYRATRLNGNLKVQNKTFTTRKPYGTLYATYYGWDGDNECHKYTLNFSNNDYYNTKSDYKWLYHENMWLPCVFTYFFVNEKNLYDGFDRDGSHFWCVKSWREEDISFEFADHHDDFFKKAVDGALTSQPITDKEYNTIQYMYENRKKCMWTEAEILAWSIASFGLLLPYMYEDRTFEEICTVCQKEIGNNPNYEPSLFSYNETETIKRIKQEHIGISDEDAKKLADKEKSQLEANWSIYKTQYTAWLNRDKSDTLEGTTKLLYNLSGRCDAAWRHEGNRVWASCLETGSLASFKIFMGKDVELPTLTEDLNIEDGLTYILDDYDVARGVKMVVPRGSTLLIRGAVNNFGSLEVYGKVIVESGSILTGDAEDKKKVATNGIVAGTVNIYEGGLFYVQEGAGHAESNYGDITIRGTYLCDGILLANGGVYVDEGGQLEIGPNGQLAVNAYPNDNTALGTEVITYLKTHELVDYVKVPDGNINGLFTVKRDARLIIYGELDFFHREGNTITPKLENKDTIYIDTVEGRISTLSNKNPNIKYYTRARSLAAVAGSLQDRAAQIASELNN